MKKLVIALVALAVVAAAGFLWWNRDTRDGEFATPGEPFVVDAGLNPDADLVPLSSTHPILEQDDGFIARFDSKDETIIARFEKGNDSPVWVAPLPKKIDGLCLANTEIRCGIWTVGLSQGRVEEGEPIVPPMDEDGVILIGPKLADELPELDAEGHLSEADDAGYFDPEDTYARQVSVGQNDERTITVVSSGMSTAAFDGDELLWSFDSGLPPLLHSHATWAVSGDTVIVGTPTSVVGIDILSGEHRWILAHEGRPIVTDTNIYIHKPGKPVQVLPLERSDARGDIDVLPTGT